MFDCEPTGYRVCNKFEILGMNYVNQRMRSVRLYILQSDESNNTYQCLNGLKPMWLSVNFNVANTTRNPSCCKNRTQWLYVEIILSSIS